MKPDELDTPLSGGEFHANSASQKSDPSCGPVRRELNSSDPYALSRDVESERLRDLDQLQVFHRAEDRFLHITQMARLALKMPMSAINLVERDHQWCKQCSGQCEPNLNVPREQTVCRATIARAYQNLDDPMLVVEDLADSEFSELQAVVRDGVRFYAGFPLFGPRGHPIGTFCIYDTEPRKLNAEDRATFYALAAWAQRELAGSDDLQLASKIQRQLLPTSPVGIPGYTFATLFEPAFAVAGDFYDYYSVPGGLIITVADVMGKGLGAALVAANVRSAFRSAAKAFGHRVDPQMLSAVMRSVARQVGEDLAATDSFVTLFQARVDVDTGTVSYIDAGHGVAFLRRASSGSVVGLDSDDLPLGVGLDGSTWWSTKFTQMCPGDMLVIASDGFLDLLSGHSEVRSVRGFLSSFDNPADLCKSVSEIVKQRPSSDDVTIVALRFEPDRESTFSEVVNPSEFAAVGRHRMPSGRGAPAVSSLRSGA